MQQPRQWRVVIFAKLPGHWRELCEHCTIVLGGQRSKVKAEGGAAGGRGGVKQIGLGQSLAVDR